MLIKLKFVGTAQNGLSVNTIYTVIALNGATPLVVNDNGELIQAPASMDSSSWWELVSATTTTGLQVYP